MLATTSHDGLPTFVRITWSVFVGEEKSGTDVIQEN
jgi:hypothetical protein